MYRGRNDRGKRFLKIIYSNAKPIYIVKSATPKKSIFFLSIYKGKNSVPFDYPVNNISMFSNNFHKLTVEW